MSVGLGWVVSVGSVEWLVPVGWVGLFGVVGLELGWVFGWVLGCWVGLG